ncbi:MAG: HAD family hydrolase [Vulcanococcus sp.]
MGLHLLHLHLHGLFRGHDLELGRDADTGGQTTYVLELIRSLAARPEVERVEVVTRLIEDRRVSPDYAVPHEPLGDGAAIVRLPFGPRRYLRKELLWPHLDALADALTARLQAQPRRPDWIHAHYADAGYVGALVAQRLDIPLVFTGHSLGREKQRRLLASGLTHEQIEQHYAISARIAAEERALAQSSLVITSTGQEAQQQYARYDGFVAEQAVTVPPGVDARRFHPEPLPGEPEAVAVLLQPFLRRPEQPPLLAICRAERRKNIPALIEAYGRSPLLQERHNLVLVLGCRDDTSAMEKQQRELFQQVFELVDRFDLYGRVAYPKQHSSTAVPALYRWAAALGGVFVNPALTEPFGLTLLEAAACGLPLVATDDGGPRDILQRCANGRLVDVSDLAALQAALEQATADPASWRRWRDNGLEAVSRSYSWDAHVCSYLGHGQRHCRRPEVMPVAVPVPVASAAGAAAQEMASPLPQRLLLLDLDAALECPQAVSIEALRQRLASDPASGLGLLSGRGFKAARLRCAELLLPEPRVWMVQAGSEIRYGPEGVPDLFWQRHIAVGWRRRAVAEALAGLAPRLELQNEAQQGPFKVSYLLRPPPAGVLEMVHRRLRQRQLAARAQLVHHWYLDVLPVRASRAEAIRHLSLRWDLPLDQVRVVEALPAETPAISGERRRRKQLLSGRAEAKAVLQRLEGLDASRVLLS